MELPQGATGLYHPTVRLTMPAPGSRRCSAAFSQRVPARDLSDPLFQAKLAPAVYGCGLREFDPAATQADQENFVVSWELGDTPLDLMFAEFAELSPLWVHSMVARAFVRNLSTAPHWMCWTSLWWFWVDFRQPEPTFYLTTDSIGQLDAVRRMFRDRQRSAGWKLELREHDLTLLFTPSERPVRRGLMAQLAYAQKLEGVLQWLYQEG